VLNTVHRKKKNSKKSPVKKRKQKENSFSAVRSENPKILALEFFSTDEGWAVVYLSA
jgi:hypothetical protein